MQIKLTISAVAKDREGKTVFQEKKLSRSVRYVIVLGEDERLARSRALQEVAEELVYRLAESWDWKRQETKDAAERKAAERETAEEETVEEKPDGETESE